MYIMDMYKTAITKEFSQISSNNIKFLEMHNTIKIVSMRVKSKYWTEIMKFQN